LQEGPLRGHIPALDGVRGFAAATVFVYHYGGGAQSSFLPVRIVGTIIHFGWAGVSLFFVLSGFLISGILWEAFSKPGWWKRFYARRSLRIFPLYYLAILIAFVAGVALGASPGQYTPLWIYILYLGNFPPLAPQLARLPTTLHLAHFWSLAVEEQFYLIWPFVLGIFAGRRRSAIRLIVFLWAASLVFRCVLQAWNPPGNWNALFLFSRAGELLAGAYLAMAVRGDQDERRRLLAWAPAAFFGSGLLIVAISIYAGTPQFEPPLTPTIGLAFCSIFFASMIALTFRPGILQGLFQMGLLRWLGKISYGIYVYHLLLHDGFVWIVNRLAPHASTNAQLVLLFGVAVVGTLTIASLSFYTYETAFLRWKERVAH
jgi:peptidoglycan/LPS O-acetylase OafA/YrhL